MIAVSLVFVFLAGAGAGAGAGMAFGGLVGFLGELFGVYGGASIVVGALLTAWVGWSVWRGPHIFHA